MRNKKKDTLKVDARLIILQSLVDHPKGIGYTELLNQVALDDILMAKLIKQLCADGWIEGQPNSRSTLSISPVGTVEYYNLKRIRRREILDSWCFAITTIIAFGALVVSIFSLSKSSKQNLDQYNHHADYCYCESCE